MYKQHGLTKKDQNMPGSTAAKLESVNERGVETGGRAGFSLAYIRLWGRPGVSKETYHYYGPQWYSLGGNRRVKTLEERSRTDRWPRLEPISPSSNRLADQASATARILSRLPLNLQCNEVESWMRSGHSGVVRLQRQFATSCGLCIVDIFSAGKLQGSRSQTLSRRARKDDQYLYILICLNLPGR